MSYSIWLTSHQDDTNKTGIIAVKDSGINNGVDPGYFLKATYSKEGYKMMVEQDKTKKIREYLFVNYLYLKYDNKDEILIAKSVDRAKNNSSQQSAPEQSTPPVTQESTNTSINLKIYNLPAKDVDKPTLVETIRNTTVDYSRYYCVVIPDYPSEGKYPFKYAIEFTNPAYSTTNNEYFFTVMGTIHNVWIQSQENMNSYPKEFDELIQINAYKLYALKRTPSKGVLFNHLIN